MYLPVAQKTPWQTSDDIDVGKTTLIVVDVLGGNEGIAPALQEMADMCVKLVAAAHIAGIPVVFADDNHRAGTDRELELWGEHGMAGTQSSLPLDTFEIGDTDIIIPKRRYDAFFGTDLDITLRELGCDTLIVVGCDTNICVLHTLAGAYFLGYKTIVAAEACATFLIGSQEAGLDYFTRCFDSRVVRVATVLDYLR